MNQRNIIHALPVVDGELDTHKIEYAKRMPETKWKRSQHPAFGIPKPLTLINIRRPGSKLERRLVVIGLTRYPNQKEFNEAHPIIRYTGHKINGDLRKQADAYIKKHNISFKSFKLRLGMSRKPHGTNHFKRHSRKEIKAFKMNQRLFHNINGILVVSGYHLGYKKIKNGKQRPYINTFKEYNFKVDSKTLNIVQMQKHNLARVITAKGIRKIVINNIIHVTDKWGSAVQKKAKSLKPVQMFMNHGISSPWIRKIYLNKIRHNK